MRQEKVANVIKELSASFFEAESNRTSLITVTHATVSKNLKRGTLFISVFPEEKESIAFDFIKRRLRDLRGYLKKNMHAKVIPFLDVKIDLGEKNRQKIEELSQESLK